MHALVLRLRRGKQRVKSFIKRWLLGRRGEPTAVNCAAARARVEQGLAGTLDNGDRSRDHCLARGYCCETGCRGCPWGHGAKR